MIAVLQRINKAVVYADGEFSGEAGYGLYILLGVEKNDSEKDADLLSEKISKLRIFSDECGKMNLSIKDVGGEILVVSQFTLYADCRKGTRPGFSFAAPPKLAESLYEYFLENCKPHFKSVKHGSFGADMKVSLVNDGPFTVMLEI